MDNTPVERIEFSSMMKTLWDMYGKPFTKELGEIYWAALSKFELEDVRRAFNQHVHNPDGGQFVPKPADIVRILEGSHNTKALEQWSLVVRAISSIGPYATVVFDDPFTMKVILDMGGWIEFGKMREDEQPFRGSEFAKRYQGYRQAGDIAEYPAKLIGIAEMENGQSDCEIEPPLLIGNPEKARAIMESGGNGTKLEITKSSELKPLLEFHENKSVA